MRTKHGVERHIFDVRREEEGMAGDGSAHATTLRPKEKAGPVDGASPQYIELVVRIESVRLQVSAFSSPALPVTHGIPSESHVEPRTAGVELEVLDGQVLEPHLGEAAGRPLERAAERDARRDEILESSAVREA